MTFMHNEERNDEKKTGGNKKIFTNIAMRRPLRTHDVNMPLRRMSERTMCRQEGVRERG